MNERRRAMNEQMCIRDRHYTDNMYLFERLNNLVDRERVRVWEEKYNTEKH